MAVGTKSFALAAVLVGLVPAAAVGAQSGAAGGGGAKHVETRTVGPVTATLSWRGNYQDTKNFRIAIERAGARIFDAQVETEDCTPGGQYACLWPAGPNPLALRDLDGDGEPEAVVAGFTGGAHCCVVALVYRWTGSDYVRDENNFLDAGYTLRDIGHDGLVEFESLDARFAYAFGSFAESVFPIYVVSFDHGVFRDVTGEFRSLVRKDLRRVRHEYRRRADTRRQYGVRAALAAYVADLWRLDRKADASKALRRALRRGEIDNEPFQGYGPYDRRYIRKLKRFLRKLEYG